MAAGSHDAITDVDGLRVGHYQRIGRGWLTGTTVVLPDGGAVAGVDVRGGGPGTRETDALEPRNLVERAHGVVLTGGSAYGLAAADGVMTWLGEHHIGLPVGELPHHVVPVIPAAVLFDLGRGGRFEARPTAEFGYRAARAARSGRVHEGSVGAGTGARAGGLRGGIGTASTTLPTGHTVAVLLALNAAGRVVEPRTGLPFGADALLPDEFRLRRPSRTEVHALAEACAAPAPAPLNTTIGVVATDAALTKAECQKLAGAAHDGLARAVRPAHSMFDGDTFFALSTGACVLAPAGATATFRSPESRPAALNAVLTAAAELVARAIVRALLLATSAPALPAYSDLAPSALA
jgi:L-aminopeptidase/D-esterase-like protein